MPPKAKAKGKGKKKKAAPSEQAEDAAEGGELLEIKVCANTCARKTCCRRYAINAETLSSQLLRQEADRLHAQAQQEERDLNEFQQQRVSCHAWRLSRTVVETC